MGKCVKKAKRAKRANRPNPREERNNVVDMFDDNRQRDVNIMPKSKNQDQFLRDLYNNKINICFGVGPAGCGKTYIATLVAIRALKDKDIKKIIITRPNIAVDDKDIGYLPGTMLEKMAPWVRPILDIFEMFYSPKQIARMIDDGIIEICPISYIRGRTFKDAFILVDEAQSTTTNAMKSILTRIGENSKMIITGDIEQSDIGKNNGLNDFIHRFKGSERISLVTFTKQDVSRHPVVEEILNLYNE